MAGHIPNARHRLAERAGFAVLVGMVIGLTGRLLSFPLNRDENMFVSVASQLGRGDLYRDLGYNHLPNLPYLLGGIYAAMGSTHYLLIGRLLMFAFWLLAILALWLIARRTGAGFAAFTVSAILLVGNVLLLREPGMLVSNNFIPIPLTFLGFYFLLGALDLQARPFLSAFAAGICVSLAIGFKANYVFVAPFFALATLLAPKGLSVGRRIATGTVPLALGGIVGGLSTLVHWARDPAGFTAHTIRYFTELHTAYWRHSTEVVALSLKDKILLAEQNWFAGSSILAIAGVITLAGMVVVSGNARRLLDWRCVMLAGLIGAGLVISFVPTPSFAQYFVPPIPFVILLLLVLASLVEPDQRMPSGVILGALAVVTVMSSASRILPGYLQLASPGKWDSVSIGRQVRAAGAAAGLAPGDRVATLTPVMALEGGYSIYPEFAAGQFVYRVAPYIGEADRPLYRTTSPAMLGSFLAQNPPKAILADSTEAISEDLVRVARQQGYVEAPTPSKGTNFRLFVRKN